MSKGDEGGFGECLQEAGRMVLRALLWCAAVPSEKSCQD